MQLAEKKCLACSGNLPALAEIEIQDLLVQVPQWQVENKKLVRTFKFDNFAKAMDLANKIASVAEEENHHPDLLVRWGELCVEIWTHKIDALSESDFVLAAKIDRLVN